MLYFKTLETLRIKVFYFFIKNLSKGIWTVLALFLSLCNLWCEASIFSMLWYIVMFLSKFGSACNILSFVLAMPWNIYEHSFKVKIFAGITSSWDIFIFLEAGCKFHSSILICVSSFTGSLTSINSCRILKWWNQPLLAVTASSISL